MRKLWGSFIPASWRLVRNLPEAGKLPEYGFHWRRLNLHDMEFSLKFTRSKFSRAYVPIMLQNPLEQDIRMVPDWCLF